MIAFLYGRGGSEMEKINKCRCPLNSTCAATARAQQRCSVPFPSNLFHKQRTLIIIMPLSPNDRNPESELDMLEHALGSMVQGVFSSMFRSIFEPSGIVENGRIIQQEGATTTVEDEFGGSDFRRLAQKSRQNRGLSPEPDNGSTAVKDGKDTTPALTLLQHNQQQQQPRSLLDIILGDDDHPQSQQPIQTGTILDLLLPDRDRFFHRTLGMMDEPEDAHGGMSNHFSFTSSSQRRVIRPDGTEESYITRTQNGVTETIRRIKHPDGTVEETHESGGKRNHNPLRITHPNNNMSSQTPLFEQPPEQQREGGLLFRTWKRIFG
ncbi:hypothetical protein BX666DRAFT_1565428 [Dichotomocladium elegans]|nr:hypothetical protein BX666DRAFT_1565428 [Dichotomocladium elegans]